MKQLALLVVLFYSLSGYSQSVTTVENFDVSVLEGKWFTFASLPAPFQDDCEDKMSATYSFDGDEVDVVNSCFDSEDMETAANGRARINPEYMDAAKIQVTFINVLGQWIWWPVGHYWVIGYLDNADQSMIVVGDPSAKFAWILSRDAQMTNTEALWAEDVLLRNGYKPCELEMYDTSTQDFPEEKSFCEIIKR